MLPELGRALRPQDGPGLVGGQVMKRLSIVLALAMLGVLATAPAAQAAPSTVFTGQWIATDHGDGSTEHLYVQGGDRPQIVYTDEIATSACAEQASATFTSILVGHVDGDTLNAGFVVAKCGNKTIFSRADGFGVTWEFDAGADAADPSDDTLVDNFGDTYFRV